MLEREQKNMEAKNLYVCRGSKRDVFLRNPHWSSTTQDYVLCKHFYCLIIKWSTIKNITITNMRIISHVKSFFLPEKFHMLPLRKMPEYLLIYNMIYQKKGYKGE